jgi:hypothetical protein
MSDFFIPTPSGLVAGGGELINVDAAVDVAFKEFGWPLLGGPSGKGWSYISVAQRCPHLFAVTYDRRGADGESTIHPRPLQVGALFHTLVALFYAGGMDSAAIAPDRGGLVLPELAPRIKRCWKVPATAADMLLDRLKAMAQGEGQGPDLNIVLETERLFDAHSDYWPRNEDVEPLAVEWFAGSPELDYTCRYDFIGRVGPHDPYCHHPGVWIFERKSAAWLNEAVLNGWTLDGEILGQLRLWEPSGCAERFGELRGICVDVITKEKVPRFHRVYLPPMLPAVGQHDRWVRFTQAQIHTWRAVGVYPQSFSNCFGRYGRCPQYDNCALGRV